MIDFTSHAFSLLKSHLIELPSFSRLVIYELLEYCDFVTGTISIDTLDEIARKDFKIAPCSGRRKEMINGETLRNALRTVKKAKSAHFKFTTKNQRIVIEMPFMRDLYMKFQTHSQIVCVGEAIVKRNEEGLPEVKSFENIIVEPPLVLKNIKNGNTEITQEFSQVAAVHAADVVTPTTHTSIRSYASLEKSFFGEDARDLAAATSCPIKDINNINNNNNTQKLSISENFVPSQETIIRAQILGYETVTDFQEIQAFIDHNKAIGSLWADYNPIYLRWLAKSVERKQQQKLSQTISGRTNHAPSRQRETPRPSARERVKQAYASQYEFDKRTGCFEPRTHSAT